MKLWTRFVHVHRTSVEHRFVQSRNGGLSFRRLRHLQEGHAAGLPRIPVLNDRDGFDIPVGGKEFSQLLLRRGDVEIPDKNVGHEFILSWSSRDSQFGLKEFKKAIVIQIASCKYWAVRVAVRFQLASLWGPSSRRTAQLALLEDS